MKQLYIFFLAFFITTKFIECAAVAPTPSPFKPVEHQGVVNVWLWLVISIVAVTFAVTVFVAICIYYNIYCIEKEVPKKKRIVTVIKSDVTNDEKKRVPSSAAKTGKSSDSANLKKGQKKNDEGGGDGDEKVTEKSKIKTKAVIETPEESSQQQQPLSNQIQPPKPAKKALNKNKVSPINDEDKNDMPSSVNGGPVVQRAKVPFLVHRRGNVCTIQPTQNASTLEVISTQNTTGTEASITGSEIPVAPTPKPKQLKKQQIVSIDKPFDYHADEAAVFGPTPDLFHLPIKCIPELKRYANFWSIVSKICVPKRSAPVFVNPIVDGTNIWFMVRDLVAEEKRYSTFLKLSNRILEPMRNDRGENEKPKNVTPSKRLYILRVFIICYYPLTLEVHCRGPCPFFLYYLFECEQCIKLLARLQECEWFAPPGSYDWNKFVCRIKQTPINCHLSTCFRGVTQQYPEDVNHIFVIRGDCESKELCSCSRGCAIQRNYHPNGFIIDADRQHPKIPKTNFTTQRTQPTITDLNE